jgi:uncharacterized protein YcbX
MQHTVGTVSELARYPVKSMRGERLSRADVESRGVVGDRQWAVYTADGGIGSGKSSRRFRRIDGLLDFRASLSEADGLVPVIEAPSGQRVRVDEPRADELLTAAFGQPLRLGREAGVRHHDDSPLHLVTTAAVRRVGELVGDAVDLARFRPNLVLDVPGTGFVEDEWVGRELRLGPDVVVRLGAGMPRCVMVDLAQGPLERDGRVLKTLAQAHQLLLGLRVEVVRGGTVRLGDPAVLS